MSTLSFTVYNEIIEKCVSSIGEDDNVNDFVNRVIKSDFKHYIIDINTIDILCNCVNIELNKGSDK